QDLNGDGIPDLVLANAGSNTVSVLLGNSDGTFQTVIKSMTESFPQSVVVGDFNGDGIPDLAVALLTGTTNLTGTVRFLLGNGDGPFRAAANYPVTKASFALAVGDFNGDGILDLVVANSGTPPNRQDASVDVLLGNGDGTFQAAQSFAAGPAPTSV